MGLLQRRDPECTLPIWARGMGRYPGEKIAPQEPCLTSCMLPYPFSAVVWTMLLLLPSCTSPLLSAILIFLSSCFACLYKHCCRSTKPPNSDMSCLWHRIVKINRFSNIQHPFEGAWASSFLKRDSELPLDVDAAKLGKMEGKAFCLHPIALCSMSLDTVRTDSSPALGKINSYIAHMNKSNKATSK